MTNPRDPLGDRRTSLVVPRTVSEKVHRTRGQRATRVVKWVAGTMAAVILLAAGGLWWAFRHYDGQIRRIAIPSIDGVQKPAKPDNGGENFLLVGSDSRAGANGIGTQGTGADFVTGQRSDTVILIHLYGGSDRVELLSFPRDSWVAIPAYTDPKTGHTTTAHHNKLNSAFAEGGPALLIATIEQLSQLRVDHFLEIDFTGFKGMVDALGGVDVCLTQPSNDTFSGLHLSAGHHHITGDVALAFVRQRHGLARGDIDRIARQQQFLGSLVHKVLSAGTLLDPFKLTGFLDVATSSLQVDSGLKAGELRSLALRLRSFRSKGVLFATVPVANPNATRDGQSVVVLDDTKAAPLFDALRRDIPPGSAGPVAKPTTSPTASPLLAPSAVRVAVYNGSDVVGLGSRAATALSHRGFTVVGTPEKRGSGAIRTKVVYGPGELQAARTVLAALPGAVLVLDRSLTDRVEVVVGSSYGKSHPATGATPTATPVVKTAEQNPCTR